jgi:hypothetical protein
MLSFELERALKFKLQHLGGADDERVNEQAETDVLDAPLSWVQVPANSPEAFFARLS